MSTAKRLIEEELERNELQDERFAFEPLTHTYRIDGARVPSVTQVIQSVLPYQGPSDDWAMQRGTAMHHGCRLFDEKRLDWSSVHPEIEPRLRAWEKFRRDLACDPVVYEQAYYHPEHRFAGTIDRVFLSSSRGVMLCDIKSTITPQAYVQLGAYSILLDKEGNPPKSALLVELRDDATYRTESLAQPKLRLMARTFLACLTVHNFKLANNLKVNQ